MSESGVTAGLSPAATGCRFAEQNRARAVGAGRIYRTDRQMAKEARGTGQQNAYLSQIRSAARAGLTCEGAPHIIHTRNTDRASRRSGHIRLASFGHGWRNNTFPLAAQRIPTRGRRSRPRGVGAQLMVTRLNDLLDVKGGVK